MTMHGIFQVILYIAVLLLLVRPLGSYMTWVYQGGPCGLDRLLGPLERFIYRLCGIRQDEEMTWQSYAAAVLWFSLFGLIFLYLLQRLQAFLPLNPLQR